MADGATISLQSQGGNFTNHGVLQGNGIYQVAYSNSLVNAGTLGAGVGDVGGLTIKGNYQQTTTGIFDVQLASLTSFDKLNVLGNMALAGTLKISGLNDYSPEAGSVFTIATFDDANNYALDTDLTGMFDKITWSGFKPGIAFTTTYLAHSIVLNAVAAPVPVPAAVWLFGSGLGWFAVNRRSRRKS